VATTDPGKLPGHSTWYLLTDLPRPTGRRAQAAELAEVVRLYGLHNWVEQGYKQVKGEVGWADFQVPLGRAIRRPGRWSAARFVLLAGIARRAACPTRHVQLSGHPGGPPRATRR